MDQHAVLEQILEWARREPNIRVVVLAGSVAREDGTSDEHSDLDVELYVRDPSLLLGNGSWYGQYGTVLVTEELENPGWHPTRLVYYADGKIDFMVGSVTALENGISYDRPFQVLIDKDKAAGGLHLAPRDQTSPSAGEFMRCVNWFYAGAIMWAKYVARSEPWAAKVRDWDTKRELLTMIEWDHKARYGWDYNTWFGGTHLREWMDGDVLAAVTDCWSDFTLGHSAAGLKASLDLFDLLSARTAVALGLVPFDAVAVRRRVNELLGREVDEGRSHQ